MGRLFVLLAILATGTASAAELREYGKATQVEFSLLDPSAKNLLSGVSCEPGEVSLVGPQAPTSPCFSAVGSVYSVTLTAADMRAESVVIVLRDKSQPGAWLDAQIEVETYGDPRARHPFGVTMLPEPEPEPEPEVKQPVYFGTINDVTFNSTVSSFQARVSNPSKASVTILESGLKIFWINGPLAGRTIPITSTARAGTSQRVQFTVPDMPAVPGSGDQFIVW